MESIKVLDFLSHVAWFTYTNTHLHSWVHVHSHIHLQTHVDAYIFSQEYKSTQVHITYPRYNSGLKMRL